MMNLLFGQENYRLNLRLKTSEPDFSFSIDFVRFWKLAPKLSVNLSFFTQESRFLQKPDQGFFKKGAQ